MKQICLEKEHNPGKFNGKYTGKVEMFENWEERDRMCTFKWYEIEDLERFQEGYKGDISKERLTEVRKMLKKNGIDY